MKKKILLALLFILSLSLSLFADETFNCRRETYVYDYRVDGIYSNQDDTKVFLFINNFMIYPYNYAGRNFIVFYKREETTATFYDSFGEYYPTYLGNGHFSEIAYGVGDGPSIKDSKIEEIKYSKTDFYRILVNEFYRGFLSKSDSYNATGEDFYTLENFIQIVNLFTKEDLRILLNTIYAKYGYTFKSKDLKVIFNEMDWYSPKENFKESFSHLDSAILEVIKLAEK